jgi:hypothetical protein
MGLSELNPFAALVDTMTRHALLWKCVGFLSDWILSTALRNTEVVFPKEKHFLK